ncbi:hypothetical protein LCGC14_0764730 [marine sediment metagenome]|uniref:Homeodomain phBC6A51-type domain-containing protein n=1 Tax=marine sediment metagenome TaxID=412755 RepID=A0A0F9Q0C4_9ZZZZ
MQGGGGGVLKNIIKSLEAGANIEDACNAAKINQSTFWRWRQADPELEEKVQKIFEGYVQIIEGELIKKAIGQTIKEKHFNKDGKLVETERRIASDLGAIQYYLFNKSKGKWKSPYSNKIDINNQNTNKIEESKKYEKVPDGQLKKEFNRRRLSLSVSNKKES